MIVRHCSVDDDSMQLRHFTCAFGTITVLVKDLCVIKDLHPVMAQVFFDLRLIADTSVVDLVNGAFDDI